MLVYPIEQFLSNSDVAKHKENRELTEKIENEIINFFIRDYGKEAILNKKYTLTTEISEKTKEILNHLKQEMK